MLPYGVRLLTPRIVQVRAGIAGVFFLLDTRVTLIDTGSPGSVPHILTVLRRFGRSAVDIERILITHAHADHAGGLAQLQQLQPAHTAVHVLDAPIVQGHKLAPLPLRLPFSGQAPAALRRRLGPPPARVDSLLHDGDELPVLGGLRVIHTPGHTPGHVALHLYDAGVLIAGDALQVRGAGRLTPPHPLFTMDRAQARASLGRLADLDFDVLALSHFAPQPGTCRAQIATLAAGRQKRHHHPAGA